MCINIKKGLIAGVVMLIASMVLSMAFGIAFPSLNTEYSNAALFRPWSDPLMSYIFVHPFVVALLLTIAWDKGNGLIKEKDAVKKGVKFGAYVWVVFSIPGILISWSTFPISLLMSASWSISGLIEDILAGIVFAKIK